MGQAPEPDDQSIDGLLEGFFAAQPDAGPEEFRAWAANQAALRDQPELISRVAQRLKAWPELEADVQRILGAKPGSLFRRRRNRASEADAQAALPPEQRLTPGTRVAHFQLRRFLAAGGMGQVWEAYDEQLRRPVALKFVRPDRVDTRSLERFEREARAGGRLSHPAIVRTLAFDGQSNPAWIAQELIEGSWTLKDFLDELRAEDKTPEGYYRHAAELIATLAEGLESAHQAGVIHRDIKPQNILIAPDDSPKLTDFGLARVTEDSFVSATGDFAGTYYYMSPEQVTAKRIGLDHRSDIFSLGVVLYELLSLRRPFEGDTTHQISQRILFFEPPQPSKIRSQCPRELSIICGKALEKDPNRRYQTMSAFAADLRRHLSNQPILARPHGALARALKWASRNPAPSSAAAVGTIALAVISGLLMKQVRTNADLALQTQRAEAGERKAQQSAERAQKLADERDRDNYQLLAQQELDALVREAPGLWPAHPELIPSYERWLQSAKELLNGRAPNESQGLKSRPGLENHRAKLAELQRNAKPQSESQIKTDQESHPKYPELQEKQAVLLSLNRMLALDPPPIHFEVSLARPKWENVELDTIDDARNSLSLPQLDPIRVELRQGDLSMEEPLKEESAALSERNGDVLHSSSEAQVLASSAWHREKRLEIREKRDALAVEVATLLNEVSARRTYEFDDPEKEWWNRQIMKLVGDLEALSDPQTGLMNDVLAEPFGWGIAKRYEFAKSIGERSVDGVEAKQLWSVAIAAIEASPKYGGLKIVPQLGLLPIGVDPNSQLWEFAHLQTGIPAIRGADGNLLLTEETGIVFVLIPGGNFWMGAQNKPGAQNHDPHASSNEGPVHEVELTPYFLSKFEMTQGQWQRIAATNPSAYQPPGGRAPSLLHPVEQVSWQMCFDLLERLGLSLPTEAQWECAARGGTSTAWWTGQERESLRGKVNLADQTAKLAGAPWGGINDWPDLEDGSVVHCAVGNPSYPGNGFGLHEVTGNVWEWCLDGYDPGFYAKKSCKDPLSPWSGASWRVYRGGCFSSAAFVARSALRNLDREPEYRAHNLGLRPCRALRPSSSPLHPNK
jgi:serine/threonine protein kinase/formylglycine-generating enzyme required for sulfatase activity